MRWNTSRRFMYGFAVFFVFVSLVMYIYREQIFPEPNCFDNKKNGFESEVDCGGNCSLKCENEVSKLSVIWTRALKTSSSTYDLVTMISNKNIDNAPKSLGYEFIAYNKNGNIIANVFGTTTSPVDGDFPIIYNNIKINQVPKEVVAKIVSGPHFSVAEKPTFPTIRTDNIRYEEGDIPRVYVTIFNTKRITISNLPVRVLLFDEDDNTIGAGETIIPFLDKEDIKIISFTWDNPFEKYPSKIRVYPIFDPFISSR